MNDQAGRRLKAVAQRNIGGREPVTDRRKPRVGGS
jgi:hypothetical protein